MIYMVLAKMPELLGKKLRQIRIHLGLTQEEMADFLGLGGGSRRSRIAEWEHGTRRPGLDKLLLYARKANVNLESLIDDSVELTLPTKLEH